jgi:hypothetical protein
MRFKVFCTTLLLAFLASVAGEAARQVANDSVADWMHRMSEALVPAESARARARLEFHELGETGVSIDMEVSRRRQPSEKHTFIEVIEPEVARGTVYEVVARGDESLERWEYLPPVRRLRRTSGIPRTDHFMGTDFTYEDLDFADALERQQGRVERVLQDDGRELVQVTSDAYHEYDKVVTLIDPETSLPIRVSFYDGTGALGKVQEFERIEMVQGHAIPTVVIMRNIQTGSISTLSFRDVEFDVELPHEISEMVTARNP